MNQRACIVPKKIIMKQSSNLGCTVILHELRTFSEFSWKLLFITNSATLRSAKFSTDFLSFLFNLEKGRKILQKMRKIVLRSSRELKDKPLCLILDYDVMQTSTCSMNYVTVWQAISLHFELNPS